MKYLMSLLLVFPLTIYAQVNDMFYVPKKQVKQSEVVKIFSAAAEEDNDWEVADNGNYRDVDEYNRRKKVVPCNESVTEEGYDGDVYIEEVNADNVYVENLYVEEDYFDDYNYTTRIVRFHSPTTLVVGSPWYWKYPSYVYYDTFWDTYWDYSWHYGQLNYNYCSSIHQPLYMAPHYSHSHRVNGTTARRIPVASVNGAGKPRVPVAGVNKDKAVSKRPVGNSQVGNRNRNERGQGNLERKVNPSSKRKDEVNGGDAQKRKEPVQRVSQGGKSSGQRVTGSSTYNRRSSTSVSRSSSSQSSGRTPVSRGGTPRGGRR